MIAFPKRTWERCVGSNQFLRWIVICFFEEVENGGVKNVQTIFFFFFSLFLKIEILENGALVKSPKNYLSKWKRYIQPKILTNICVPNDKKTYDDRMRHGHIVSCRCRQRKNQFVIFVFFGLRAMEGELLQLLNCTKRKFFWQARSNFLFLT